MGSSKRPRYFKATRLCSNNSVGTGNHYVKEAEEALTEASRGVSDALTRYFKKQVDQLSDLVELTHTDLSRGDRTKDMVMDAHARYIVEKMIRSKVNRLDSFIGQSQLKRKFRVPRDPHLRWEGGDRAEVVNSLFVTRFIVCHSDDYSPSITTCLCSYRPFAMPSCRMITPLMDRQLGPLNSTLLQVRLVQERSRPPRIL